MSKSEIDTLIEEQRKNPGAREAQKRLAQEVTTLVHGEKAAESAMKISEALFGSLENLKVEEIEILKKEAPSCEVQADLSILDALVEAKLASSKREGRQFLSEGAILLNGNVVGESTVLAKEEFAHGIAILKRGKRNVCVLVLA